MGVGWFAEQSHEDDLETSLRAGTIVPIVTEHNPSLSRFDHFHTVVSGQGEFTRYDLSDTHDDTHRTAALHTSLSASERDVVNNSSNEDEFDVEQLDHLFASLLDFWETETLLLF